MPPKPEQRWTAMVPRTHAVQQRTSTIQTSGIFELPLELFLEVFSYLTDHRRFIRENYYGRESYAHIAKKDAERSIVIRRLTMTCWPLRNLLLPLLWANAEGCISHTRYDHDTGKGGSGSSLYAQCVYLSLNPAIAAFVQAFSVGMRFKQAPEDLMTTFVDCLIRLPNLKTLEVLTVSSRAPISKALKRKYAIFPSIRELRITPACHHFVRNCPNLEILIFTSALDTHAPATVQSHGKGLKRIAGVDVYSSRGMHAVGWGCPDLREIGIVGSTRSKMEPIKQLRRLKHLAVVEVDLEEAKNRQPSEGGWEDARKSWKRELISLLKDSPSTDRKILKWKVNQSYRSPICGRAYDIMETEELEVFPGTSA